MLTSCGSNKLQMLHISKQRLTCKSQFMGLLFQKTNTDNDNLCICGNTFQKHWTENNNRPILAFGRPLNNKQIINLISYFNNTAQKNYLFIY